MERPTIADFKRNMQRWLDGLEEIPLDVAMWDIHEGQYIWALRPFYIHLKDGMIAHRRGPYDEEA